MKTVTIAVDAMGGDFGLKVTLPAALHALDVHPDLHIILVGQESQITLRLKGRIKKYGERLKVHHAEEIVGMDELPSKALRYKKQSSMRLAINLVHQGIADACVSAGNTGALMATARFVLKTLPGVDRPAIVARIPSDNPHGFVRMLDLGANVDCTPDHLQQFAVMGSILAGNADGVKNPRVALLNIGAEEIKGNELVREAAELLAETKGINYIGFVEGNDIFADKADVIVCDGFTGNVALKVMEGEARTIRDQIRAALTKSFFTKLGALFILPALHQVRKRMSPAHYNGASMLGLKGIVIKSHGNTTPKGFFKAIERAYAEVDHKVPEHISSQVHDLIELSKNTAE